MAETSTGIVTFSDIQFLRQTYPCMAGFFWWCIGVPEELVSVPRGARLQRPHGIVLCVFQLFRRKILKPSSPSHLTMLRQGSMDVLFGGVRLATYCWLLVPVASSSGLDCWLHESFPLVARFKVCLAVCFCPQCGCVDHHIIFRVMCTLVPGVLPFSTLSLARRKSSSRAPVLHIPKHCTFLSTAFGCTREAALRKYWVELMFVQCFSSTEGWHSRHKVSKRRHSLTVLPLQFGAIRQRKVPPSTSVSPWWRSRCSPFLIMKKASPLGMEVFSWDASFQFTAVGDHASEVTPGDFLKYTAVDAWSHSKAPGRSGGREEMAISTSLVGSSQQATGCCGSCVGVLFKRLFERLLMPHEAFAWQGPPWVLKGDQPRNWRAPTQTLDRHIHFNAVGGLTVASSFAFVLAVESFPVCVYGYLLLFVSAFFPSRFPFSFSLASRGDALNSAASYCNLRRVTGQCSSSCQSLVFAYIRTPRFLKSLL